MILEAKGITKTYVTGEETIRVLENVNLKLNTGEIIVIMGPSGSGKSTLLHILGTLDTPDRGTLTIDGEFVDHRKDLSRLRAKKIGFVFQYHYLLPEFTVMENLLIPQTLIGRSAEESEKKANKLLEYVGLLNRKNHLPGQISGGEKQRVAVLRALINDPPIALADEPSGNLDAVNRKILMELIGSLKDEFNQSFIIATHDEKVAEIADKVLFLNKGNLLEK